MSKKILVVALGLGMAHAATIGVAQAAPPTWYAGGDIVRLKTQITDNTGVPPDVSGSANATTLRLKGGAHILDWLDAEAHLIVPKSEAYSNTGGTNSAKTSVLGLFAKPNVNVGPVNFYGLAGFASVKIDLSGTVTGSESKSGLAYGAGVQYAFTKNISGSIDYTHYLKKSFPVSGLGSGLDAKVSAIGVGVTYTFK